MARGGVCCTIIELWPRLVPHWRNLSSIKTIDSSNKDLLIVPCQRFCLQVDFQSGGDGFTKSNMSSRRAHYV
ncbi:hypothetical protein NQZ68_036225 [Dissostichus eleginoides]|nr:hypothetical protein NQZ68_036225 [Dissostichus eleginoides]